MGFLEKFTMWFLSLLVWGVYLFFAGAILYGLVYLCTTPYWGITAFLGIVGTAALIMAAREYLHEKRRARIKADSGIDLH